MPEGVFICDKCGWDISNPPADPKPCPHMRCAGMLRSCSHTSTTCQRTKELGKCKHVSLSTMTPDRVWPVHKMIGKELFPWDMVNDEQIN